MKDATPYIAGTCTAHVTLFIVFDGLALEHLPSYGLIFRGLVWALIFINAVMAYMCLRQLTTKSAGTPG